MQGGGGPTTTPRRKRGAEEGRKREKNGLDKRKEGRSGEGSGGGRTAEHTVMDGEKTATSTNFPDEGKERGSQQKRGEGAA